MKLTKFRVMNFRSIKDTGFISVKDLNGLVGMNGAGKTNILLALWKFNPFIKKIYNKYSHNLDLNNIENNAENKYFIQCIFEVKKQDLYECFSSAINEVNFDNKKINMWENFENEFIEFKISKTYQGNFKIEFYEDKFKEYEKNFRKYDDVIDRVSNLDPITNNIDEPTRLMINYLINFYVYFNKNIHIIKYVNKMNDLYSKLEEYYKKAEYYFFDYEEDLYDKNNKISSIALKDILFLINKAKIIIDILRAKKYIYNKIPKIIYYYNYLNWFGSMDIDENINYLVTKFIKKIYNFDIINAKEDKKKTKILKSFAFDFSKLFGLDNFDFHYENTIINSHNFSIKNDLSKKEISLKNQSNGFKWLLNFYINFCIDKNKDLIFLFDELGTLLHPKLQKKLLNFLENISKENQIFYTTHSPFLINSNMVSNCFIIYKDKKTNITKIFNYFNKQKDSKGSEFYKMINVSLGLEVLDLFFKENKIILVEGSSDVVYFEIIKNYLKKHNKWQIPDNIVFLSASGHGNIKKIRELFESHSKETFAIYDSDIKEKEKLKISNEPFFTINDINKNNFTVEDLFDTNLIKKAICEIKKIKECKIINDHFRNAKNINSQAIKNIILEESNNFKITNVDKFNIAKFVEKKFNEKNFKVSNKKIKEYMIFQKNISNILYRKKSKIKTSKGKHEKN